jgi:hypothetical protein
MASSMDPYNVVWTSQSKNSGESMPCGGGDIGLNVWVEDGELLLYLARAGFRDENGALLKAGRVRLKITPNPFEGPAFRQELKLREGCVTVEGKLADGSAVAVKVWVEVARPIAHVDIRAEKPVAVEAGYESWRTETIELPNDGSKHARRALCMINYDRYPGKVFLHKDVIRADADLVRFHHRVDNAKDCFAFQIKQQRLEGVRGEMVNPLENLVWGGALVGDGFARTGQGGGNYAGCTFKCWAYTSRKPSKSHRVRVCLHVDQVASRDAWDVALGKLVDRTPEDDAAAWRENQKWWGEFWDRSRLIINPGKGPEDAGWRVGRNYQLFRYMLASNATGREPSMFNGGLLTFDPLYVNNRKGPGYTPDHRQWGAALTAQNQRMLVWPLLKTGDFDMVPTGLSFYLKTLPNATARVRQSWKHDGCAFGEQVAITGLPGSCVYGFVEGGGRHRPKDLDPGQEVNHASGYLFQGQLEYSWLMLRYCQFSGADLARFLPFVEQSVIFYDEHYRFRCKQLTGQELDDERQAGDLPGQCAGRALERAEPHQHPRGPAPRPDGTDLQLPEKYASAAKKKRWRAMLDRLPAMPTGESEEFGGRYLKPEREPPPP